MSNHPVHLSRYLQLCVWLAIFIMPALADITPTEWLAAQPQPAFKAGHTMPRLTRYAYALPYDVTKELTERWGYALQLHEGYLSNEIVARLDDPNSREAKIVALTLSNPQKYPLFITTSRQMPAVGEVPDSAWTRNANGQILTGSLASPDGTPWSAGAEPLYSTEAPDSVWALAGEYRAAPLRALIKRGVPVNIVLNGGEYGMGCVGLGDQAGTIWGLDPIHNAAVASSIWGDRNAHCSQRSANSQRIIADAVRAATPQRSLYVFYAAGGRTLRNNFWGQDFYGGYWEHNRGISDIPSNEIYYNGGFNSGFTGSRDVLTMALNATSLEIASGDPLSYNWITGGWQKGDPANDLADITRWTGFLKCYFTAGMIGGNVGCYADNNTTIAASFPSNAPTYYLRDLVALSHVQALFSQVEGLLRNSDLLPGPMKHALSITEPAYEFPTGDAYARVLARKHRTNNTWLITAWAASGANRFVTVSIPELGQLSLEARICGSVYTATLSNGQVTLIRLDDEGATYTAVANGTPVVTPVNNATLMPPSSDCLLWLDAEHGITADGTGKVSSWASQGSVGLTLGQTEATRQPIVVANAISGHSALHFSNNQFWLENNAIGTTAGSAFIGTLNVYAVFTGATVGGDNRVISATANGQDWETGKGFKLTDGIANTSELKNGILLKVTGGQIYDTALNAMSIGTMHSGGYMGFSGDLAEILIYKAQSAQSSSLVTAYLKDKYNLRLSKVVNGGFEAYPVSGYQYSQYTPQTPGWINCGSAVQANGSVLGAPSAPEGTQTAVLQGKADCLANMSQTIDMAAGTYTVHLKAAKRLGQIQPVKISIDGTQIGTLITPIGDTFTEYITQEFTVTAGYHTLRLQATDNSGDKSTFIDDVVLSNVVPKYQAVGKVVSGTGVISPIWPTHVAGDVALLVVESANQAVTLSVPAGFVAVANSPQGTGTAGSTTATCLTVFWKRATTSAEATPTVADSGDHQVARIITFRGVTASGNPWDVTAGNVATAAATAVSFPNFTTTVANTLVVSIVTNRTDITTAQNSAWTNANLTSLTERMDNNVTAGNGGGFGVATGVKATAGAVGTTTSTLLTSSVQGRMCVALKP